MSFCLMNSAVSAMRGGKAGSSSIAPTVSQNRACCVLHDMLHAWRSAVTSSTTMMYTDTNSEWRSGHDGLTPYLHGSWMSYYDSEAD